MSIKTITQAIVKHPQNATMKEQGYKPVFSAHPKATVLIIGQAPGIKAQTSHIPWDDKSGERLRRWLGVDNDAFYDTTIFALLPMDFYFPGNGKTGDLPPRPGFAELWHPQLLAEMPNIKLTLLIGQYAQKHYLPNPEATLTKTVQNYKKYLKGGYLPIPHPSPRNNIWCAKNPWFENDVVPALQKRVRTLL